MKSLPLLLASLITSASLVLADGIPVDRKTGKVEVPHTVIPLTAEQIEETQTLGTFTFTSEQWQQIRVKLPQCPKRFINVVPLTWNDCTCGFEEGYVIALSRDQIAVLHGRDSTLTVQTLGYALFRKNTMTLRMNDRGEFFHGGMLIPFATLLEALANPPVDARGKVQRYLYVELPTGSKQTDAVFESRLKKVAAAADKIGLSHTLFPQTGSATDS